MAREPPDLRPGRPGASEGSGGPDVLPGRVYGLPTIVWVGVVVPFFTSVLGRDRAPWIMAKCLQFYRKFVFGVLYPVASRVAGRSGFH